MQRRPGRRGDRAGDPENEFDAGADIDPDRRVEAERVERGPDQRARHREEFDHGQRQRVADQHIGAEIVEVIGHERGGRRRRAERGDEEPERLVDEMKQPPARRRTPLRRERIGPALIAREPRLQHRDQRADRGEGQLEADAEDRLRLQRDHREHGEAEIAHRQRAPVGDDRAEGDQRHDQRAFGPDARAGADVIGDRAEDRDSRRPFLDRMMQRERRREREQPPRGPEEDARDQRHLHAGDGDDVEDAGLADEIPRVARQEIALAGHHRRGDRAFVAADDRLDPRRERVARMVDRGAEAQPERRLGGRRRGGIAPSVEPTAPTPAK